MALNKGAAALRRWRHENNYSQGQGARVLNLSADSQLSRLERGHVPGLKLALHVSGQLGIDPALFLQPADADEVAAHWGSGEAVADEPPADEDEVQAATA